MAFPAMPEPELHKQFKSLVQKDLLAARRRFEAYTGTPGARRYFEHITERQMTSDTALEIVHLGHRTRLKWHQLRKSARDPVFDLGVMREGFALGASLELDLRMRADGGFVVLHDDTIENETTGSGRVATMGRAELERVRYKSSGTPLITSEALAAQLGAAHADTVLQFDIKDDLALLGETGLGHIGDIVGAHQDKVIVSSLDLQLIAAARDVIPDIPRGIDPTGDMASAATKGGVVAAYDTLLQALEGPTDAGTVYLYWPMILAGEEAGHDLIAACHRAGKLVDAWTFNLKAPESGFDDAEWSAFKRLMDLRPDQITTDEAPATEHAWRRRINS